MVQGLSSSQGTPSSAVWVQPLAGLQASAVQGFLSSQFFNLPGLHLPAWQLSPAVHRLPSASQGVPSTMALATHWPGAAGVPALASQVSLVQAFLSSQVPSSVWPLQSSSRPLQVSGLAAGAVQGVRPWAVQVRWPGHEPLAVLA
jgi:hypothetical protein